MRLLSRRTALILAAALFAGQAAWATPVRTAQDMSLGNPKAKIEIIEYASLSCSHCAHFNETVFPDLKRRYVDTGKVRYTIKEMMTEPQQIAAVGWLLARCAGPTRYFKVVDEVFRSQSLWEDGKIKAVFDGIAQANGVSPAKFQACLADKKAIAALNARAKRAYKKDGVDGTPTFFVNGKRVDGDLTLETFDAAIAAAGGG